MRIFEVVADGFDGSDDKTDNRVLWVVATEAADVERAIERTGAAITALLPADYITDIDFDLRKPSGAAELRARLLSFKEWVMTPVKTATLIGAALDWAVEKAKGTHWSANGYLVFKNPERFDSKPEWRYSTDWSQGGPIIERQEMQLSKSAGEWGAYSWTGENFAGFGPTILIAAMRCYVASKLGDEVEVPEELLT